MMETESSYYTKGPNTTNPGVKNFPCEAFSRCQPNEHQVGWAFKDSWEKTKK